MDLLDSMMDVGSCVVYSTLLSIAWWAALMIGSVVLKRYNLRPWLERHFVQRLQLRTRRLRDTLSDPVLVLDLERTMEKRYKGNRQRVLEAMEQLRQNAEAEVPTNKGDSDDDDHDAKTKGDEKKQAAKTIMYGTVVMALSIHTILNIFVSIIIQTIFQVIPSYCEMYGWSIECILFSLIHLIDSFMIYHDVHKMKRSRFAKESVASSSSEDLQELLQLCFLSVEISRCMELDMEDSVQ
jgi:hypothetical protein